MTAGPLSSLNKPKRSRKKLYWIIGILVVIIGAVVASAMAKKREKPIFITTDKAFRKTITQLVTATGKIQPEVEVKIAPEVSGEIIEIPVKEGQAVRRGQLVLKIKPDNYQAQVEAQQAGLNSARSATVRNRAEVEKAENDYKRSMSLFNKGLVSEADRKSAETNYNMAKAALEASQFDAQRAEGALRQMRDSLSKTIIYAPM